MNQRNCSQSFRCMGAASLVIGALLAAPHAHAEDLSSAVYDDFKVVIQELMVDEVAHTAVPNAACQAPVLFRYYPHSLQRLYDRQFGSLKGGLQNETAALLGSFVYYSINQQRLDLRGFLAHEVPRFQENNDPRACAQAVKEDNGPYYFARRKEDADQSNDEFRPLLDLECLNSANPPNKLVACEFALASRDFLMNQPRTAEDHLRRLVAYLVGLGTGFTQPLELEDLNVVLAALIKDPTLTSLPPVKTQFGTALIDSLRAIARQWQLVSHAGVDAVSPRALTDALISGAVPIIHEACKEDPACRNLLDIGRNALTRDLIAALQERDTRAIAVEALRAAFTTLKKATNCTTGEDFEGFAADDLHPAEDKSLYAVSNRNLVAPTCLQQTSVHRYGRFVATLVSYVMEAEDGKASEATREAFRSAAFDLLRTDGPQSGFDRGFLGNFVMPQPSLRFSWSPGYINEATTDGFRYVAALDELTVRRRFKYTDSVYLAGTFSALDLLGPFSEAALRKQNPAPSLSGRAWFSFINPRAEFAVGFPSLSKHLVLAAGISYRATAAFHKVGSDSEYTYFSWLTDDSGDYDGKTNAFFSQFIESSLAIRYVP